MNHRPLAAAILIVPLVAVRAVVGLAVLLLAQAPGRVSSPSSHLAHAS